MLRHAVLVLLVACNSNKAADRAAPATQPPAPATAPAVAPPKGPVVDPASFDRTCTAATDCVIVKPATCDPCGCPTDAIASKEMARFDEAAGKLACEPPDLTIKCQPCAPRVATCEHNACVAAPPS